MFRYQNEYDLRDGYPLLTSKLYKMLKKYIFFLLVLLGFSIIRSSFAVINVGLQPGDLYQRYLSVISTTIQSVDVEAGIIQLKVKDVFKGEYSKGEVVSIEVALEEVGIVFRDQISTGSIAEGKPIIAFIGKKHRTRSKDILFYTDGFQIGELESNKVLRWKSTDNREVGTDGEVISTMMGTWNGSSEMLIKMMSDIKSGRYFFPRKAYAKFQQEILLDKLAGEVKGVSLFDIDNDGDLDVFACSDAGNRIYLQMEPMVFVNATTYMDLGMASSSCAFADVNQDGYTDLLADGIIYQGFHDGYKLILDETDWLPYYHGRMVKSSAFVELNGDGNPDVIISFQDGGLGAFINTMSEGSGGFEDKTEAMGLSKAENGAGLTGYFAPGDWNLDNKTDIFYAAENGFLLVQNEDGVFYNVEHSIPFDFISGQERSAGFTGAGSFIPMITNEKFDLIIPTESSWHVVENKQGSLVDVTEYGNEISEGSYLHIATLAKDLNLDGYVDLFTTSRGQNGHNRFIINRGYGSFMLASVHKAYEHMFWGEAMEFGGWGIASGDVDMDGSPDLLYGNKRGDLFLILNQTLEMRVPVEFPDEELSTLLGIKVLSVKLSGNKGIIGAQIILSNSEGEIVGRSYVGSNINAGAWSPPEEQFAVNKAGKHQLKIIYSDGVEELREIELSDKQVTHLAIYRK